MNLADQLSKIREVAKKQIPAEALEVMHQATDDLRIPATMAGIIKVGDTMPPFCLKNTTGTSINSADLLARGPLVVTFFRGHW